VDFDSDAVIDFEDVKSRGDRKAVFNVVQKLKDLGPDLPSPHMKFVEGRGGLVRAAAKAGSLRGSANLRAAQRSVRGFGGCSEEEGLRAVGRGSNAASQPPPLTVDNKSIIMRQWQLPGRTSMRWLQKSS
jgi:hypothetical protein